MKADQSKSTKTRPPKAAPGASAPPAKPKVAAKPRVTRAATSPVPPPVAPPAAPPKAAPKSKKKAVVAIPPILLEGDAPAPMPVSGPGERFALGPAPMTGQPAAGEPAELPESYGTQRLLLTARDPHWIYAHWDFTLEQLRRYNARSVDRHLVLRVYLNEAAGEPHREIHLHPESRNWFANVGRSGAKYVAQLGYYRPNDQWVGIATSGATCTPPDSLSDDMSVWFATLPADLHLPHLVRLVKSAIRDNVPLLEAIQQLRASGFPALPSVQAATAGRWTSAQEEALGRLVSIDSVRRVWMGSLEITELIRRQFLHEMSSQAAAQLGQVSSWSGALGSVSSPFGIAERRKGFWFNVNAELIIYGATEPDAKVTIGGRAIKLRPDGSFSYRFALPDGEYPLPAVATSADETDSRSAGLKFSRTTAYSGEVGKHPQDPQLRSPVAAHLA